MAKDIETIQGSPVGKRKVVFQIQSLGSVGNTKIEDNPLYDNAIEIEENSYLTDGTDRVLTDHAQYIIDVITGVKPKDEVKFPGIVWEPETSPIIGTDYVAIDPASTSFINIAEPWAVKVLTDWSISKKLKYEYIKKAKTGGAPAAYNSFHIFF